MVLIMLRTCVGLLAVAALATACTSAVSGHGVLTARAITSNDVTNTEMACTPSSS
jgi:hypothetical protein